jgi:drug/metabolite transporter (DMT)-like permease
MIILNKYVAEIFRTPAFVLSCQCLFSFLSLYSMHHDTLHNIKIFTIFKKWIPIAICFACNICTSMASLMYINVGTFSVLRCTQPILSLGMEYIVYKKTPTFFQFLFLILIFVGSLIYYSHDFEYNKHGYSLVLLHNASMVMYLFLVKQYSQILNVSPTTMSFLNNAIVFWGFSFFSLFIEGQTILESNAFQNSFNCFILFLSCLCGLCISISAFGTQNALTPTQFITLNNVLKLPAIWLASIIFSHTFSIFEILGMIITFVAAYAYAINTTSVKLFVSYILSSACILTICIFFAMDSLEFRANNKSFQLVNTFKDSKTYIMENISTYYQNKTMHIESDFNMSTKIYYEPIKITNDYIFNYEPKCLKQHKDYIQNDLYLSKHSLSELASKDIQVPLDLEISIQSKCMTLLNNSNLNLIFFIMAYKNIAMLEKLISKLSINSISNDHQANILIIIHIDMHTNFQFYNDVIHITKKYKNACLIQSGTIVYLSASEMKTIFTIQKFLLTYEQWKYFIPLTGQDYSLISIQDLETLILYKFPNKTWVDPFHNDPQTTDCCIPQNGCPQNHLALERLTTYVLPSFINNEKVACKATTDDWLFYKEIPFHHCKSYPMFTGIFTRNLVSFFQFNFYARLFYAYWVLRGIAAVEHYYASLIYNSLKLNLLSKNDFKFTKPCEMTWSRGKGDDGPHNRYLTMNEMDIILDAMSQCTPFSRKFDLEFSGSLITEIDKTGMNANCI